MRHDTPAQLPTPTRKRKKLFRTNGCSNGPLRAIVTAKTIAGKDFELLECGHLQAQYFAESELPPPRRRRCRKCKDGEPVDIAPGEFFATNGEGQRATGASVGAGSASGL